MPRNLTTADAKHLKSFTHRGQNLDDELEKQTLLFRQLLEFASDTVAHSAQMLWDFFTDCVTIPNDARRAGREHLMCLLQGIRAHSINERRLLERLRDADLRSMDA